MEAPIVTIHPIETRDGVLVKVQPPFQPSDSTMDHVPCDIVIVIDVSDGMNKKALASATEGKCSELSILDLAKHATRVIMSTLDDGDRLGVVTFGSSATVIRRLNQTTEEDYQKRLNTEIDRLKAGGQRNIRSGIDRGLHLFHIAKSKRVPAMMILTTSQANYAGPAEDCISWLRLLHPLPATINTFDFLYDSYKDSRYGMQSGLLKSIAEVSNGNYAFIADASKIGSVFSHAVAHLQSTYATQCTLAITPPEGVLLKSTTGKSIDDPLGSGLAYICGVMTLQLGNLQYGQSRDIFLSNVDELGRQTTFRPQESAMMMTARFRYKPIQCRPTVERIKHDIFKISPLPKSVIAYHQSRSMVCKLLSSFFEFGPKLEYNRPQRQCIGYYRAYLQMALSILPARHYTDQPNESLMWDLQGQIDQALSNETDFDRWGCHFFLSLWNAHSKQMCNSFTDPGPLMYNDNPFFDKCREVLVKAFDDSPPPLLSNTESPKRLCFVAWSPVLLAKGVEVPVCTLQQGMMVKTPVGPRRVRAVLKNAVHEILMCSVGDLVVTPWHPINIDPSKHGIHEQREWDFPIEIAESIVTYSGAICSVLLDPDDNVNAHAIRIGGVWGATLGHGIVGGRDARAHPFFGDYRAISKELSRLGPGEYGVYWGVEPRRDHATGVVRGFECSVPTDVSNMRAASQASQQIIGTKRKRDAP